MKYNVKYKQLLVERYHNGDSIAAICNETGVPRSTLYSWVATRSFIDSGVDEFVTIREYTLLKQRMQKLEIIIHILKAADCTISSPLQEKLSVMESLHDEYSGYILCEALEVPRGTFYNHIYRNKREASSYSERRAILRSVIKEVFDESGQRFGSDKINAVLHDRGYATSPKLVAELMREMGLYSISPSSKREHEKWKKGENKNVVQQKFSAGAPNKIWVSDITVFKFHEKYYYICIILDLFSRKIVAYRLGIDKKQHSA